MLGPEERGLRQKGSGLHLGILIICLNFLHFQLAQQFQTDSTRSVYNLCASCFKALGMLNNFFNLEKRIEIIVNSHVFGGADVVLGFESFPIFPRFN